LLGKVVENGTMDNKTWRGLFYYWIAAKTIVIFASISVGAGGVAAWCDCTNRTWASPFQSHLHNFGWLYQFGLWTHVIGAICGIIPTVMTLILPKGDSKHVFVGRIFVGVWVYQIFVGTIMGANTMLSRGPYPGQDESQKATNHYWGAFSLYVFYLFSFVESCVCENLLNGTAALQYRDKEPPGIIIRGLIFGSTLTLLNGMFMMSIAMFTLINSPDPTTAAGFYPWVYFFFVPVEMFMAIWNLRYWNCAMEERKENWLFTHIRCMTWTAFYVFFFSIENGVFKVISVSGGSYAKGSYWWLLPGWFALIGFFSWFIFYSHKNSKGLSIEKGI